MCSVPICLKASVILTDPNATDGRYTHKVSNWGNKGQGKEVLGGQTVEFRKTENKYF